MGEMGHMNLLEMNEPINIELSSADSRSLIMPHQQEAVDALSAYFHVEKDLPDRNGMLVMPTGSGKTYTAVTWLLSQGVANGYRVVWLVHRQELVEQTYREFRKQAPILKGTGIKKIRVLAVSGIHMKMSMASRADVYVCSIASVANKYGYRFIERMIGAAGQRKLILVVDECHHAVAANYQKAIKRMTVLNKNRILLGLTATPKRMQESEQRKLQQMFNINLNLRSKRSYHGYVYEVTLKQLLMSGYLAKPIYERVDTEIVGEVAYETTAEDEAYFQQFGELSEKLKNQIARSSARNQIIVRQYLENQKKYGKTLIFAVNQMHAETLYEEFKKAGIACDYAVSGRTDAQEVIRRFKNNQFDVLINVQILTEGSDVPDIKTVFLTRQTNSDSLLMQMIGRGLRGEKAGGTKEANIVAFHDTWNTFAHWLDPGALDIFEEEKDEDKELWLKELYDKSDVLKQIYRYFYAFKKTVYDAMKTRTEAVIQTEDGRERYNIIENYYDLNQLLDEVKEMFPLLRTDKLVKLAWSNRIVKSWFALCERFSETDGCEYEIHVNKLLSSPDIDLEVIKYLIFHELLHQNGYWAHDDEFRKREWQYPDSARLDGTLDGLYFKYDMDELMKDAVYNEFHSHLPNEKKSEADQSETSTPDIT